MGNALRPYRLKSLFALIGILFVAAHAHPAMAQIDRAVAATDLRVGADLPIDLEADSFDFDHDAQKVRANGNVVVTYGPFKLTAQQLVYDIPADRIEALGTVTLTDTNNNVITAEHIFLEDRLSRGLIQTIKVELAGEAWMVADKAERESLERAVLYNAAFSTCVVCEDNPDPLWQIRAKRVIHDNDAKDIIYRDAYFDFMGVPIMWVPYFRHADPSVDRRTGFLLPGFSSTDELGAAVEIPFYWELAPYRDMTITPVFATEEIGMLKLQYRERFNTGQMTLDGSITHVDDRDDFGNKIGGKATRGHFFGKGAWTIGDTQQIGFEAERASDDTYLRRFDFTNQETLTSRLFYDYISALNHLYVEGLGFQGLRVTDDEDETPIILPSVDFHMESGVDALGGRFFGDVGLLGLYRKEGIDMVRGNATVGWHVPYVLPIGSRLQITAKVRLDGYLIHDDPNAPANASSFEPYGRAEPMLTVDWRMPFIRTAGNFTQIVEPIILGVLAPYDGTSKDIPNEDSQSFEFDASNLFDDNRFNGLDLMESGPRLAVGMQWTANWNGNNQVAVMVGQNFRPRRLHYFAAATGLRETTSDYVGKFDLALGDNLSFKHRVRLDRSSFSSSRQEVTVVADYKYFDSQISYLQLDRTLTVSGVADREELRANVRVPIYGYWSIRGAVNEDLSSNGGPLRREASLIYEDECFYFEAGLRRKFARDRDIKPSTSFTIRVRLTGITSNEDDRSRNKLTN